MENLQRINLQVYVSKKNFIDNKDPGYIEVSGKAEGQWFKFGDKYKQRHVFETVGVQVGLSSACFKTRDEYQKIVQTSKGHIPMVLTETMVDSTPPILLHLNTYKKAKSGNYVVNFIFTYSVDGKEYFVTEKEAHIHLTSLIERHQWKIAIVGIIIALTSPGWGEILSNWVKTFIIPWLASC